MKVKCFWNFTKQTLPVKIKSLPANSLHFSLHCRLILPLAGLKIDACKKHIHTPYFLHPYLVARAESWNHLNTTNCPNFLKPFISAYCPLYCLPLKGFWTFQFIGNNLTHVYQIIALAPQSGLQKTLSGLIRVYSSALYHLKLLSLIWVLPSPPIQFWGEK